MRSRRRWRIHIARLDWQRERMTAIRDQRLRMPALAFARGAFALSRPATRPRYSPCPRSRLHRCDHDKAEARIVGRKMSRPALQNPPPPPLNPPPPPETRWNAFGSNRMVFLHGRTTTGVQFGRLQRGAGRFSWGGNSSCTRMPGMAAQDERSGASPALGTTRSAVLEGGRPPQPAAVVDVPTARE